MTALPRLFLALLLACAAFSASAADIRRVESPGGIVGWLVSDDTVPLLAVKFAFTGGAAQDPDGKAGVANMVSGLLDEGAGDMDAQQFQRRAEELAIRYNFDAGRDAFYGELRTLSENIDAAVDLVRIAISSPRFDEDAVERIRGQIVSGLRGDINDPDTIASRAWMQAIFGDHPYGRPIDGTMESVARIGRADLAAFARANFARDNLHVAAVGDISEEAFGLLLDRLFSGLPEKASLRAVPQASLAARPFETVIDTDVPQTVIQFGGPGLMRHDPDFVPAYVLNHILGGGTFTSRLYDEIREKRGLAYGVDTYLYPLDHAALFGGGVATRGERAAESLRIIREEIARIAADGPTQAELDEAKAYLKGSYPLRFDTSGKIAGQLLQIQIEELGIDYIERRNSLIDAVTIDDVRRAAGRLFADGAPYVTIVGRKAALENSGG